ncbi:hypothetical protein [Kineococcus auxinigenes]|uniref:hypothetical protein n=1 Tax=unclassified Kineococcus TaxID=2621656 RepID=UPI003D7E40B9
MSALEQAVKPILEPMILGQKTNLSVQDAEILAAWLMKTAYVSQGVGDWFATGEEMQRFAHDSHRPPENLRAWIGAWRGGKGGDVWTYAWEWAEDSNTRQFLQNSHFTVFAIGHVAVVVARSPDPNLMAYSPPGRWGLHLKQLWPTSQTVAWPPLLDMTLERVLKLRRRYVNGLNAR